MPAFSGQWYGGHSAGARVDGLLGKVVVDATASGNTLTLTLQGSDGNDIGDYPRSRTTLTFNPDSGGYGVSGANLGSNVTLNIPTLLDAWSSGTNLFTLTVDASEAGLGLFRASLTAVVAGTLADNADVAIDYSINRTRNSVETTIGGELRRLMPAGTSADYDEVTLEAWDDFQGGDIITVTARCAQVGVLDSTPGAITWNSGAANRRQFIYPSASSVAPVGPGASAGIANISREEIYNGDITFVSAFQAQACAGASIAAGDAFYVNCGKPTSTTNRNDAGDAGDIVVSGARWRALTAAAAGAAPTESNSLRFIRPDPRTSGRTASNVLVWVWLMRQADNTPMIAVSDATYGHTMPLTIVRENLTVATAIDADSGALAEGSVAWSNLDDRLKARFADFSLRQTLIDRTGYSSVGMIASRYMGQAIENDIPHIVGDVSHFAGVTLPRVLDRVRWGATTETEYDRVIAFTPWQAGSEYLELVGTGGTPRAESFYWNNMPPLDANNNGWIVAMTIRPETRAIDHVPCCVPFDNGSDNVYLTYQRNGRLAWKLGHTILIENPTDIAVGDRRRILWTLERHPSNGQFRFGIGVAGSAMAYSAYATYRLMDDVTSVCFGNFWTSNSAANQFRGQISDIVLIHAEDIHGAGLSPDATWAAAGLPADRNTPYGALVTLSAGANPSKFQYQPLDGDLLGAPQTITNVGVALALGDNGILREDTAALWIELRSMLDDTRYRYRVAVEDIGVRTTLASRFDRSADDHVELSFYGGLMGHCRGAAPAGYLWNTVQASLYDEGNTGRATHLCMSRRALSNVGHIDCFSIQVEPRQE